MKKTIFILFCILQSLFANAVTVEISDGIYDQTLKERIERNASILLTEINRAQAQNSNLDFTYKLRALPDKCQRSLSVSWEISPFKCTEEKISVKLLNSKEGYQIRGISILMIPTVANFDEPKNQEAFIDFDKDGHITGFNIAIIQNQFEKIVNSNLPPVADLERRQIILNQMEQYRQAWMMNDIDYIDMIYSSDAIIITGTVIHRANKDGIRLPDVIKYNVKDKDSYMSKLRETFSKYEIIKVYFDDIEIVNHPILKNYYGVTLKQTYFANGQRSAYNDVGYVFLLWQFPEQEGNNNAVIHVRTWQPEKKDGKPLPENEKFSLNTFEDCLQ